MGKRILVQRRGDGGMRYRSHNKGKIAPASYPFLDSNNTVTGIVKDLLHERGRSVPLAKIIFNKVEFLTNLSLPLKNLQQKLSRFKNKKCITINYKDDK